MMESRYNVYIPYHGEKYILYNTLNRSVLLIENDLKEALAGGEFNKIGDKSTEKLIEYGMLRSVGEDELKIAQIRYEKEKFSKDNVTFIILPTFDCNLACTYCYQAGHSRLKGKMSEETLNKTVKFIVKVIQRSRPNSAVLGFFGGEPLMAEEEIFQLLDCTFPEIGPEVKKGVSIVSNSTLLRKSVVQKLKELRDDNIRVNFFTTLAGDQKCHDEKRIDKSGGGTYNRVLKSLQLLHNSSINVSIRVDIVEKVIDNLENLLQDLQRINLKNDALIRLGVINPDLSTGSMVTKVKPCKSPLALANVADKFAERGFAVRVWNPLNRLIIGVLNKQIMYIQLARMVIYIHVTTPSQTQIKGLALLEKRGTYRVLMLLTMNGYLGIHSLLRNVGNANFYLFAWEAVRFLPK